AAIQTTERALPCQHRIERLAFMILAIEFAHDRRRLVVVLAEVFLLLVRIVPIPNSIIPLVKRFKRRGVHTSIFTYRGTGTADPRPRPFGNRMVWDTRTLAG